MVQNVVSGMKESKSDSKGLCQTSLGERAVSDAGLWAEGGGHERGDGAQGFR